MKRQPIVCVVGPTAIGKTDLSLDLAQALHGEIVSADSMQVYRHMDIGTGKIPVVDRRSITHHMIDVVDPWVPFTVHEFAQMARSVLSDLDARQRIPIVVGGTGLYVKALIDHFDFAQTDRDPSLRDALTQEAERVGAPVLHERLRAKDPLSATRIHPNDLRRVIRALEIVERTGRPVEANRSQERPPYAPILIGLTGERERLYQRIERRIDHMVEEGLVAEVERLLALGCDETHTAMQAIGYKEILQYVRGTCSLEAAVAAVKQASRRYAKRQWSWFRADSRIVWYEWAEDGMMLDVVLPFIEEQLERLG
ncbi:MAG: tRNA (adenosine(37)-N6)-dimethylallyltransferase MiaA [Firmicutes bacterium]|nr:tRNA (adenosine(37)-N6)-dimethylallyltransferase MiaA [Bacillota bacterium]